MFLKYLRKSKKKKKYVKIQARCYELRLTTQNHLRPVVWFLNPDFSSS